MRVNCARSNSTPMNFRNIIVLGLVLAAGIGFYFFMPDGQHEVVGTYVKEEVKEAVVVEVESELVFIADEGIRMENSSNAAVKYTEDGQIALLFQDRLDKGYLYTESESGSDWLDFERGNERVFESEISLFKAIEMPDGTWMSIVRGNSTVGIQSNCMQVQRSEDGENYVPDEECFYEWHESDNERVGVYDFYFDLDGNLTMLYIGDLGGSNNIRKAVSYDGGLSMEFVENNPFGDINAGGGSRTYVDQRVIRLENDDLYMISMKAGLIYAHRSTNDGQTWAIESAPLLTMDDFPEWEVMSLHDPQIIQLPDGRYRIYVTAKTGEGMEDQMLVSATTEM